LNTKFRVRLLNTSFRKVNAEKGKIDIRLTWEYLRFFVGLLGKLSRERPDVLYQSIGTNPTGLVRDVTSLALARAFHVPVVVHLRGGEFRACFDLLPRLVRALVGTLLGSARLVLVEGRVLRGEFSGLIPEERIAVVGHPVADPTGHQPRSPSSADRITLLYIGHLSIAKGWRDLLLSLRTLTARWPGLRLLAMGAPIPKERNVRLSVARRISAPEREEPGISELQEVCQPWLTLMGGEVAGSRKASAFEEADIFVLPSYSEGLSVAILEAMHAGLPVVTTAVGASPEVVEHGRGGYLVPPGRPDLLVDAIERLLADPAARRAMGAFNRALAHDRLGETAVLERYAQLFEQALVRNHAS
jgi:glycosyltransferase involved in cell wall biosynthesis